MTPLNGDEWVASIDKLRAATFENHQILARGETWWEIGKPNSGDFMARIIAPGLNRIVIVGDGPDMILRCYCDTPEEAVRWLAKRDPRHGTDKVCAGEQREWVCEVALFDLNEYAQETFEENGEDEPDWIGEAREGLTEDDWDKRRLVDHVADESRDYEIVEVAECWGDVPSADLITTIHAARVLVRLLDAERAGRVKPVASKPEPPLCPQPSCESCSDTGYFCPVHRPCRCVRCEAARARGERGAGDARR